MLNLVAREREVGLALHPNRERVAIDGRQVVAQSHVRGGGHRVVRSRVLSVRVGYVMIDCLFRHFPSHVVAKFGDLPANVAQESVT